MKKIFFILSLLFVVHVFAQDAGRVKLTFPQGEWVTISTKDAPLVYGGVLPGTLPAQATVRALLDENKNLLAVLFIRAGEYGISRGKMNWNAGCKNENTEYIVDATEGSYTRLDCLRVWREMTPETWLQKNTKQAYADLEKLGVKYGPKAFQIVHAVGTDNGTFVYTNMIIPYGTLKKIPDAAKGAKFDGKPGVAFGHLFADAIRTSTRTMSGELTVPPIDYR